MQRKKIDFGTVRKLARALGEVEESTIHGASSLKVRGKLLTCIPVHVSAEPDSVAVRIDFERRAELIAAASDVATLQGHMNVPISDNAQTDASGAGGKRVERSRSLPGDRNYKVLLKKSTVMLCICSTLIEIGLFETGSKSWFAFTTFTNFALRPARR
jgi:hypothetical protein